MSLDDHPIPPRGVDLSCSESDHEEERSGSFYQTGLTMFQHGSNVQTYQTQRDPFSTPPNSSQHQSSSCIDGPAMLAMLQQQQAMLSQIDSMDKQQLQFEKKLDEIESKLPESPTIGVDTPKGKRTHKVSRALSVSYLALSYYLAECPLARLFIRIKFLCYTRQMRGNLILNKGICSISTEANHSKSLLLSALLHLTTCKSRNSLAKKFSCSLNASMIRRL